VELYLHSPVHFHRSVADTAQTELERVHGEREGGGVGGGFVMSQHAVTGTGVRSLLCYEVTVKIVRIFQVVARRQTRKSRRFSRIRPDGCRLPR